MGSDLQIGRAAEPPSTAGRVRPRRSYFISEFESDIRQLYSQMLDEPVPPRLLDILRGALAAKS